jgi:hypothetical protein
MKTKFLKTGWKILYIAFGIFFIGMIVFGIFVGNIFDTLKSLSDIIWVPIFMLICYRVILSKWRLRKFYVSNKIYNEPKLFEIDDNSIIITSESTNVNLKKEKITKIEFDKDSIYIFPSLLSVFIIKQRFLKNIDEYTELKNFIIKYYK